MPTSKTVSYTHLDVYKRQALDPEQNSTFNDHFIDMPFDLSHVLFITTANDLSAIPGPLRDRMDVIELPSYTRVEKYNIARKHLVPKQLDACGLTGKVTFSQSALYGIIDGYTREADVYKRQALHCPAWPARHPVSQRTGRNRHRPGGAHRPPAR